MSSVVERGIAHRNSLNGVGQHGKHVVTVLLHSYKKEVLTYEVAKQMMSNSRRGVMVLERSRK